MGLALLDGNQKEQMKTQMFRFSDVDELDGVEARKPDNKQLLSSTLLGPIIAVEPRTAAPNPCSP